MKESTGNNADIDFHCINCEKLKFELQQVKLEIASYAAIVRLMQQENSSDPRSTSTMEIEDNTEPTETGFRWENPSVNSEWTLVTSKKQGKKGKDNEKCSSVITNHLTRTANKFSPLIQYNDQHVSIPSVSVKTSTVLKKRKISAANDVGFRIPTVVNGKNSNEVRNSPRLKAGSMGVEKNTK